MRKTTSMKGSLTALSAEAPFSPLLPSSGDPLVSAALAGDDAGSISCCETLTACKALDLFSITWRGEGWNEGAKSEERAWLGINLEFAAVSPGLPPSSSVGVPTPGGRAAGPQIWSLFWCCSSACRTHCCCCCLGGATAKAGDEDESISCCATRTACNAFDLFSIARQLPMVDLERRRGLERGAKSSSE